MNDWKEQIRKWDIIFVRQIGPFKTVAMIGTTFIGFQVSQTLGDFQKAYFAQEITPQEYRDTVLPLCIILLIVALYGCYYLDLWLKVKE